MPPLMGEASGRQYWRSVQELADTPEFQRMVDHEFPGLLPDEIGSASRRQFLKVMGASLALAGVTGCNNESWPRWPESKILPYAFRPDGRKPMIILRT